MACWTKVNPDSELYQIFGDSKVPILSIIPFVPRESGMPLCYMVLGQQLPDGIVNQLAQKIYETWASECESLEMAREYVLKGIPLKTSHFSGANTDDYFQMPHGAALNIASHINHN